MNDLKLAACEVALFCLGIPRRALQHVEGRILRARRKLIGPWSIALAALACVALGGCVPGGGPGAVVGAIGAVALVVLALFTLFVTQVAVFEHIPDTERLIGKQVAVVFVVLAALTVYGCHGAERATRTALDVTAHAVAAADTVVAREYADAARKQLAAATDLDDYHRRMARWDRAESALRAIVSALYAAEASLDAADATSTRGALACVYTAAVDLLGALSALDVPIPQALARAVDTLGAFVGECQPTSLHRVDQPAHDVAQRDAITLPTSVELGALAGGDLDHDLLIDRLTVGARPGTATATRPFGLPAHAAHRDRSYLLFAPLLHSTRVSSGSFVTFTGRMPFFSRRLVTARRLGRRVFIGVSPWLSLSHDKNVMPISEIGNAYFRESTRTEESSAFRGVP